jgi:hypothetical protein
VTPSLSIAVWCLAVTAALLPFPRREVPLTKVNVATLFFVPLLALNFLALPFALSDAADLPPPYDVMAERPVLVRVAAMLLCGLIGIGIGCRVGLFTLIRITSLRSWWHRWLARSPGAGRMTLAFAVSLFAAAVQIVWIGRQEGNVLWKVVAGSLDPLQYVEARQAASLSRGTVIGYVQVVALYGVLIPLVFWLFEAARARNGSWLWVVSFGGTFLAVLGLSAGGQKGPLLIFAALLTLQWLGGRRIWRLGAAAGAVFAGAMFLTLRQYDLGGTAVALQAVFERIAMAPLLCLYATASVFPEGQGFLFGSSQRLVFLLKGGDPGLYRSVWQHLDDSFFAQPSGANALWIQDAYADFGFAGVIVESLLLGVVLAGLVLMTRRAFEDRRRLPLLMFAGHSVFYVCSVPLVTTLWSYGLAPGVLFLLILGPPRRARADPLRDPM